jgi:two-component system heavy metal sensor histidine kinase CusS
MRRHSITRQLTLLIAACSTSILLAIGAVLGVLVDEHFVVLDVEMLEGLVRQLRGEFPAGTVVNATPDIAVPAIVPAGAPRTGDGLGTAAPVKWREAGRTYRGIAERRPASGGGFFTVVAAVDTSHHDAFMTVLWKVLWGSALAGMALSLPLAWLAARHGMGPIREITALAARVSADRLGERIPDDRVPVELVAMCSTFNGMLARLEDSFRRLSEFSADLAHELRTPVTNVMTQTQVALSRVRGAEEYREVLYSNLEEFQELARIVEDMLFLAKSEHGAAMPRAERVDIGQEVEALADFFDAAALERGVALERSGAGVVVGDRAMIRRAIANLISNALRHTAPGGTVRIALSRSVEGMRDVTVENRGPDIAPQHIPRLFDRFYRVDAARRRGDGGSGLGLAITKAIAELHRGGVAVRSHGGLTAFTLSLPAARDDAGNCVDAA